ncbi:MAG: hypothetical protein ACT4NL_14105 [Pseudomarimonas sp.]
MLMKRDEGNLTLLAAAYKLRIGALVRYGGVPPYPETLDCVAKVLALHQRYREALAPRGAGSGSAAAP